MCSKNNINIKSNLHSILPPTLENKQIEEVLKNNLDSQGEVDNK